MVTCEQCGREFKTPQGLGGHVTLYHRIRQEDLQRLGVSSRVLEAIPSVLERVSPAPGQTEIAVLPHESAERDYFRQSSLVASAAPSPSDRSLAQAILSSTSGLPKPQSTPAITFSRPRTFA